MNSGKMSMSMLPADDSEVMYFFPIVFITGPVNNGPLTACALLAGETQFGTCWIGCLDISVVFLLFFFGKVT